MVPFIEELISLVVWLVANAVYLDARRKGQGGFRRFLGFWMGLPGTFFSMVLVTEGSQPVVKPPPDDEEALLSEVRQGRALKAPEERGSTREPGEDA